MVLRLRAKSGADLWPRSRVEKAVEKSVGDLEATRGYERNKRTLVAKGIATGHKDARLVGDHRKVRCLVVAYCHALHSRAKLRGRLMKCKLSNLGLCVRHFWNPSFHNPHFFRPKCSSLSCVTDCSLTQAPQQNSRLSNYSCAF